MKAFLFQCVVIGHNISFYKLVYEETEEKAYQKLDKDINKTTTTHYICSMTML